MQCAAELLKVRPRLYIEILSAAKGPQFSLLAFGLLGRPFCQMINFLHIVNAERGPLERIVY